MQRSVIELLDQAKATIGNRGEVYGGIENNFQLAADMASLRLGRDIHPYEVAVILCCVKNARAFATPDHEDSHIDAANYELFAATFAEDYARNATAEVVYKRKQERELKAANPLRVVRDVSLKPSVNILADKLDAE